MNKGRKDIVKSGKRKISHNSGLILKYIKKKQWQIGELHMKCSMKCSKITFWKVIFIHWLISLQVFFFKFYPVSKLLHPSHSLSKSTKANLTQPQMNHPEPWLLGRDSSRFIDGLVSGWLICPFAIILFVYRKIKVFLPIVGRFCLGH